MLGKIKKNFLKEKKKPRLENAIRSRVCLVTLLVQFSMQLQLYMYNTFSVCLNVCFEMH